MCLGYSGPVRKGSAATPSGFAFWFVGCLNRSFLASHVVDALATIASFCGTIIRSFTICLMMSHLCRLNTRM